MGVTGMEGIKTLRIFPKEKNSSPNSPARHMSEKSAFRIYFLINLTPKSVKADFILGKDVLEEFPPQGFLEQSSGCPGHSQFLFSPPFPKAHRVGAIFSLL